MSQENQSSQDEILNKLINGEIKLYQLESICESVDEAVTIRRKFIEEVSNTQIEHLANYSLDMGEAVKRNIENPIGAIQIPIGVAGPLKIKGTHVNGEFFVPLATTEGALVASVNRGASTITASGGVNTHLIDDKMTRAPAIKTNSISEALTVKNWMESNFTKLKSLAESTTSHGKLIKIDPIIIVGDTVYPRFVYSTGDSMGMNMVTIATETILYVMEEELGFHALALSGNLCTDKKPSYINLIGGRGKTLSADILIKEDIVKSKLKTTAVAIEEVNTTKNLIGSAAAGSMGFNAHYANMIGALFLATGQDEAHVVEGSLGITTAENRKGDLYFSVNMQDVPIATVGGGTRIETAQESLDILGVNGSGNVAKFAEIVIATVLAGEISLIGALAAGHLAKAHNDLGRG